MSWMVSVVRIRQIGNAALHREQVGGVLVHEDGVVAEPVAVRHLVEGS